MKSINLKIIVIFVSSLGFSLANIHAENPNQTSSNDLNLEIQIMIANFINDMQKSELKDDFDEKAFHRKIDAFITSNGVPDEVDLTQLLLFNNKNELDPADASAEMISRVMLYRCIFSMETESVLATLAPLMDVTKDSSLSKNLEVALKCAFSKTGRFDPNNTDFKQYLAQRKSNPPYGLIRYMYRFGREEAVDTVGSVYGDKSTSPHVGTGKRGLAAVKGVAEGGHWWEELYAAEQMRQNKNLRDPELIEQLKKSEHAIVREAAQEIE